MGREHFRIGILGGMGPEAGVLLQQLIIRFTPAERDQDHIETLTYTSPHVPDRTESLQRDGGTSYVDAVSRSLQLLDNAGVDIIIIACNTAHARIAELQNALSTPILDIVQLARTQMSLSQVPVGVLATTGTINEGLFSFPDGSCRVIEPDAETQAQLMRCIHDIKKGSPSGAIMPALSDAVYRLIDSGCQSIVLGCTELSIYHDELTGLFGDRFIDPLRLAAKAAVEAALSRK